VIIKPTHGINSLLHAMQQIEHRGSSLRIARRAHHVIRFIKCDVDEMPGLVNQLAIDLDVIAFDVSLRAKLGDNLAIDRNAAFQNELLGLPPRSHAGSRNDFLQTFFSHYSCSDSVPASSSAGWGISIRFGCSGASGSPPARVPISWNSFSVGSSCRFFNPN